LPTADVVPDGRIARSSVDLEQRHGDECLSLIDYSPDAVFAVAEPDEISREQFKELWTKGVDTPFWLVG
jgi:hypothetical protein